MPRFECAGPHEACSFTSFHTLSTPPPPYRLSSELILRSRGLPGFAEGNRRSLLKLGLVMGSVGVWPSPCGPILFLVSLSHPAKGGPLPALLLIGAFKPLGLSCILTKNAM